MGSGATGEQRKLPLSVSSCSTHVKRAMLGPRAMFEHYDTRWDNFDLAILIHSYVRNQFAKQGY